MKINKKTLLLNIVFGLIAYKVLALLFNFFILDAVFIGNQVTCKASAGFCYPFIIEKFNYIMFGPYPRQQLYLPVCFIIGFFTLGIGTFLSKELGVKNYLYWLGYILFGTFVLMGYMPFTDRVEFSYIGGLPLTLIISGYAILFSYPIGIFLALCRTGNNVLLKTFSVVLIELIRGVPLITLLFMSSLVFPLFFPEGVGLSKFIRAQVFITIFASCYMAEVFRGGILSIDKGQIEAARSLGLNYFQIVSSIVLPQALSKVIIPSINTMIGMFKDTSLVIIIALFDFMYTAKSSLKDMDWHGNSVEAYIFIAIIYFGFCYGLGLFGRKIERKGQAWNQ